MTDLESRIFLIAFITSNVVATLMLIASVKWPTVARFLFFFLFAWACWANWSISHRTPEVYLDYSRSAFFGVYRSFINGWFSKHIQFSVGFIAVCQGLIAISMLMRGWVFKTGAIGTIVFLLAISPLGLYAAFPCTIIMAIAMYYLLPHSQDYIWIPHKHHAAA